MPVVDATKIGRDHTPGPECCKGYPMGYLYITPMGIRNQVITRIIENSALRAARGDARPGYSTGTALPWVPWRVNSKRTSFTRRAGTSAGGNVHFFAAVSASRAK